MNIRTTIFAQPQSASTAMAVYLDKVRKQELPTITVMAQQALSNGTSVSDQASSAVVYYVTLLFSLLESVATEATSSYKQLGLYQQIFIGLIVVYAMISIPYFIVSIGGKVYNAVKVALVESSLWLRHFVVSVARCIAWPLKPAAGLAFNLVSTIGAAIAYIFSTKPVDNIIVERGPEKETLDLVGATFEFVYEDGKLVGVTEAEGYIVKIPVIQNVPNMNKQTCDDVKLERSTDQGRSRLTASAAVPQFCGYFYDNTTRKVVGNGGRVKIDTKTGPQDVFITSDHVVHAVYNELKAGHEIVLMRLGDLTNKAIKVTLEPRKEAKTLVIDQSTCKRIRGLDLVKILMGNDLASSIGMSSTSISHKASTTPEWWYKCGDESVGYLTSSSTVVQTKHPFVVQHDGSTEPGASGALGLVSHGGKHHVAYVHFASHPKQKSNFAINVSELWTTIDIPNFSPKEETNGVYVRNGPRTRTDPSFDPEAVVDYYVDPDTDISIGVDNKGRAGWMKQAQVNQHGDLVIEWYDGDYDKSSHKTSMMELEDFGQYFPLGAEMQGDMDMQKARQWLKWQLETTICEALRKEFDEKLLVDRNERNELGKKMQLLSQRLSEIKQDNNTARKLGEERAAQTKAEMDAVIQRRKAITDRIERERQAHEEEVKAETARMEEEHRQRQEELRAELAKMEGEHPGIVNEELPEQPSNESNRRTKKDTIYASKDMKVRGEVVVVKRGPAAPKPPTGAQKRAAKREQTVKVQQKIVTDTLASALDKVPIGTDKEAIIAAVKTAFNAPISVPLKETGVSSSSVDFQSARQSTPL